MLNRSRKYVTLTHKDPDRFYYVGKGGSLRSGRTHTNSFPCDVLKSRILAEVQ